MGGGFWLVLKGSVHDTKYDSKHDTKGGVMQAVGLWKAHTRF
jgi:hypothetical protein